MVEIILKWIRVGEQEEKLNPHFSSWTRSDWLIKFETDAMHTVGYKEVIGSN